MTLPSDYKLSLTNSIISEHFPNLRPQNFKVTSLKTDEYNCIAWAKEINDEWDQLYTKDEKLVFDFSEYLRHFKELGFSETEEKEYKAEYIRIALYYESASNKFKHVARQLSNGKWTSKLGDWEDIEHETPEDLAGKSYGDVIVILEKLIKTA